LSNELTLKKKGASAGWPNGKALLSGGKDCGFESRSGRFLPFVTIFITSLHYLMVLHRKVVVMFALEVFWISKTPI
jgi:hypothetical protein